MFDRIQPTGLRITIRCLAMVMAVVLLTLIDVVFVSIFIDSEFWIGWVSAFLYCVIFPNMSPGYRD